MWTWREGVLLEAAFAAICVALFFFLSEDVISPIFLRSCVVVHRGWFTLSLFSMGKATTTMRRRSEDCWLWLLLYFRLTALFKSISPCSCVPFKHFCKRHGKHGGTKVKMVGSGQKSRRYPRMGRGL